MSIHIEHRRVQTRSPHRCKKVSPRLEERLGKNAFGPIVLQLYYPRLFGFVGDTLAFLGSHFGFHSFPKSRSQEGQGSCLCSWQSVGPESTKEGRMPGPRMRQALNATNATMSVEPVQGKPSKTASILLGCCGWIWLVHFQYVRHPPCMRLISVALCLRRLLNELLQSMQQDLDRGGVCCWGFAS